ncbi:MAG: alginate export family protein [Nitrospirae bacterium]|nr:alginate export family protein [Nitrospirota bacterium]
MKKFLVILLGAVFVLGFAASAFAIHAEIPAGTAAVVTKGVEITLGGYVRERGFFENNTSDLNDDKADHTSLWETSVVLSLDAKITPNTQAKITIRDTKNSNGDDDMTWGSGGGDDRGIYLAGGNALGFQANTLQFIEAWIMHSGSGLLGIPAGIKVGHMPLALGNKLFFSHTKNGDDALVLFANPIKELEVDLLNVKFREGNTKLNDDADAYVGLFNYRTKEFGISGDVTYVNDQVGFGSSAADKLPIHLWNFGLRGDANVSGFTFKLDGEVQTGAADGAGPDGSDLDFSGWAVLAGVGYDLSGVKLGLEYAYGSGDNGSDPSKYKGFVTALDNVQHYSWIYEYRTVTAAGVSQTGINNTQYVKASIGANLAKDLKGNLDFYWLRANKLTALQEGTGADKTIGFEIDPYITWQIDKNLVYWVEGGYLFAGDFYKVVTGPDKSPDNAYAIRHGIKVTF